MKDVTRKGDLFYDGDGNVLGFAPDASAEVRQQYRAGVEWAPTVSRFAPLPSDTAPDGRRFEGQRVGDIRGPGGLASVQSPGGDLRTIDLSAYGEDERVRISWQNVTAQRLRG
jgi:hypothetical protein